MCKSLSETLTEFKEQILCGDNIIHTEFCGAHVVYHKTGAVGLSNTYNVFYEDVNKSSIFNMSIDDVELAIKIIEFVLKEKT